MIKILLVDDNADNLMSMEVILEKEGYTFSKAVSGKEALKILLKDDEFSLILLDVRMPVMDGYETAELIYQREKLRNIPIIFITGLDYEDTSMFKGYKIGAVDYIRKPVNPQILRSKVGIFAELHNKNHLLQRQEDKLICINDDLLRLNQNLEMRVLERTCELENLNHELKNLNISKDKLLSVISHDLRNPLSALLMSSDALSSNIENHSSHNIETFGKIIHSASQNILKQLNELLEWAKIQQEKIIFNAEKLHLVDRVDQSFELLKNNSSQKGIVLENKVPRDIYVNADTLMLRSILQNLVTNAIKYTPPGGLITVTAQSVNNLVEIFITDSGIGMEGDISENLFTNINSISASGTNNEKGSGLGLILVKDFVTQHGGTIRVVSEAKKGTCIIFTIPEFLPLLSLTK